MDIRIHVRIPKAGFEGQHDLDQGEAILFLLNPTRSQELARGSLLATLIERTVVPPAGRMSQRFDADQ